MLEAFWSSDASVLGNMSNNKYGNIIFLCIILKGFANIFYLIDTSRRTAGVVGMNDTDGIEDKQRWRFSGNSGKYIFEV